MSNFPNTSRQQNVGLDGNEVNEAYLQPPYAPPLPYHMVAGMSSTPNQSIYGQSMIVNNQATLPNQYPGIHCGYTQLQPTSGQLTFPGAVLTSPTGQPMYLIPANSSQPQPLTSSFLSTGMPENSSLPLTYIQCETSQPTSIEPRNSNASSFMPTAPPVHSDQLSNNLCETSQSPQVGKEFENTKSCSHLSNDLPGNSDQPLLGGQYGTTQSEQRPKPNTAQESNNNMEHEQMRRSDFFSGCRCNSKTLWYVVGVLIAIRVILTLARLRK